MAPNVETDPFLDTEFAPLDTRSGPEGFRGELAQLAEEHPELIPQDEEEAPAPAPAVPVEVAQQEVPPPPPVEPTGPTVTQFEDGSSVSIEKTNKGWKATLDTGTGAPSEVFYGKTKDELMMEVLVGKANATRKIRELNRKVKLGYSSIEEPEETPSQPFKTRPLTADEIFEIKNDLQANPDLAFDKLFQKKTGMTIEQLVNMAQEGKRAKDELSVESVAKNFVTQVPDYYSSDENMGAMIAFLAKQKLGKAFNGRNGNELIQELFYNGHWTVKNLKEAFNELDESGLLEQAPSEETPVAPVLRAPAAVRTAPPAAPPAQPATSPTPANERIVRVERRPRVGLGIRPSEATQPRQEESMNPPSVEELENLDDKTLSQLFTDVRRASLRSVRR